MPAQHGHPGEGLWRHGPILRASDRSLARYVVRPVAEFLRVESAGGILLVAAAVVALVWANSPWREAYDALWSTHVELQAGGFGIGETLRGWVNDALMVIFFFVVGLEIKYELVAGNLRDPKAASVPIVAALGGMVAPALIYVGFAGGTPGAHGWGIPMATDIAFAVGVLALLGRRIPSPARIFLLTLAVVDDIGAIVVIAVFYTTDLSLLWLGLAALTFAVMVAMRALRVWALPVYVVLGVFAWFATFQSGVHATIAGVAAGLLTPATPLLQERVVRRYAQEAVSDHELDTEEVSRLRFLLKDSLPMVVQLQHRLHPVSSYVVLPIFALANAGIYLGGGQIAEAIGSPVTMGVLVGLLLGKVVGITVTSWAVIRARLGSLPEGATWPMMIGLGILGGIGFTVSLFITELSFPGNESLTADAKVGILAASLLAAILGTCFLLLTTRPQPADARDEPAEGNGAGVPADPASGPPGNRAS